ncbi:MAG: GDSL-type esterase/lipase family protein [Pirellulales bacterium]
MNSLVYHIVSGHAFFSGIALLILAIVAANSTHAIIRRISLLSFLLGVIAIVISSTAIPYWLYAAGTVVTLSWFVMRSKQTWRRPTMYATIAVWLLAAAMEVPYHVIPTIAPVSDRKLTILGDSVTAGVGGDEKAETWPTILARQHHLLVQDISHMGDTAESALKRAKSHAIDNSIIIVEIGGNDILGSTTAAKFETDLDALLSYLVRKDRQIVMFELPLPPFYHEFGRIQRTLAAKHNAILLPKRIFLSVIAGGDATLDSIHLSQSGHQRMADTVWHIVSTAYSPSRHDRSGDSLGTVKEE